MMHKTGSFSLNAILDNLFRRHYSEANFQPMEECMEYRVFKTIPQREAAIELEIQCY